MNINAIVTPSLLSKYGVPQSNITLNIPIKLRDLDDVYMPTKTDGYVVAYDEASDKFILTPNTGGGGGGGSLPNGNPGDTLYYSFVTGEEWIATNNLYNDGTNIGILNQSPEEPLHVNGNIKSEASLILAASSTPLTVNINEINLYVKSSYHAGQNPYTKEVVLYAKDEKGYNVIISSTLY